MFALFLLISTGFISAQNSLGELLSAIDETTAIFFAVFLISFSLLFFALNKVFKSQNTAISGIISLAVSFLIVYGLSKSEFSVGDSLSDIGISSNILSTLLPIVIIAIVIYLIVKFKGKSLYIIGGALLVLGLFILRDINTMIILAVIMVAFVLIIRAILKFTGLSVGKGMTHSEAVKRNIDAGAGI